MLKKDKLEQEIKKAFDETIPKAFEIALKLTFPKNSDLGDEVSKKFGEVINELLAEPLAKRLAAAIDYHVRSAEVYGTIITSGSPSTQVARVKGPNPMVNGKVPNTLGIK